MREYQQRFIKEEIFENALEEYFFLSGIERGQPPCEGTACTTTAGRNKHSELAPENSWQLPPFSSVRRNGGVLNKLSYALPRALLHTPSASPPRAGIPVAFDQCREFLCVCKPSCIMVVLMTTLFIKIAVLPLGTHQIMQTALQPMSFLLH